MRFPLVRTKLGRGPIECPVPLGVVLGVSVVSKIPIGPGGEAWRSKRARRRLDGLVRSYHRRWLGLVFGPIPSKCLRRVVRHWSRPAGKCGGRGRAVVLVATILVVLVVAVLVVAVE
jgi:hypothetical protein